MSDRYPGGFLKAVPPTTSQESAPGVWTLEQALVLQKAGLWPVGPQPDPYFNYTTLLLHGDGAYSGAANGQQNNTFLDSSANNFTFTRNGNPTQGSFSPFRYGWSNVFDGSGDYLTVPGGSTLAFGTDDFTIEFWVYARNLTTSTIDPNFIDFRPTSTTGLYPSIQYDSSESNLRYFLNTASVIDGGALSENTWHHIALARSGTSTKMFVDGTQVGSTYTDTNNYLCGADRPSIAAQGFNITNTDRQLDGYISNLRIVKGTALYTENFTPPTATLTAVTNTVLLTCQSGRFVDNSTNNFAVANFGAAAVSSFSPFAPTAAYSPSVSGGSGYFDGTDWISTPDNAAFTLGSSDFTVEMWVYSTVAGVSQYICGQSPSNGATVNTSVNFNKSSTNKLVTSISAGVNYAITSTDNLRINQWVHIVFVRDGDTLRQYINGEQTGSLSVVGITVNNSTAAFALGRLGDYTVGPWRGYISNFRMVVGTCVYPNGTTFTPPTAPVTAITNTALLCNFTNAGIFDQTGMNVLETVGNAQVDTTIKKFGAGSMELDGTGDYIVMPSNDNFLLGAEDFTIELWAYPTSNTRSAVFSIGPQNTSTSRLVPFQLEQTSQVWSCYMGDGTTAFTITGGQTSTINTWNHLAVVRSSGSVKVYVNGVGGSAVTVASSTTGAIAVISGILTPSLAVPWIGLVDDLRVTKSIARYTSNFIPPTRPFPDT